MPPAEHPTESILRLQQALLTLFRSDRRDFDRTLRKILEVDAATLGVERVSFWEYAPDRQAIVCRLLYRRSAQDYSSGTTLRAESYPRYFRALEEHLVLPADDAWSDPRTSEYRDGYLAPNGIGAMMDVPVWLHGRVCGIVCHEHVGGDRPWRFGEQLFAAAVANFVSLALETRDAARAAVDTEARCRDIFQRLPLGVYRSTRQGRLLFANLAAAEMLGFPDVKALKRIDSAESLYVDPEERARWIAQVEQTDVVMGLEMRFRRRDGAIVWVRNSARAVRDASGRMTHFEGALEDIDEWKRAQSKLAAEHATNPGAR
jgi:PAS domain S-box-containing protein